LEVKPEWTIIRTLPQGNRRFVAEVFENEREYFTDLNHKRNPTVRWIGGSESGRGLSSARSGSSRHSHFMSVRCHKGAAGPFLII
jgi:hypothetical protein